MYNTYRKVVTLMSYTVEDILRIAKEKEIKFLRLQFTDIFGQMKNIAITENMFEKVLTDGQMFDGSSIEGFVRIDESDMYLKPDLDTFTNCCYGFAVYYRKMPLRHFCE